VKEGIGVGLGKEVELGRKVGLAIEINSIVATASKTTGVVIMVTASLVSDGNTNSALAVSPLHPESSILPNMNNTNESLQNRMA
jgi:hypothetical protein